MFKNRQEAGKKLAEKLFLYKRLSDHVVIGLARGGVAVAKEVACALGLPLEVLVPRKIGAPMNPEFAIGAIVGDEVVLDSNSMEMIGAARGEIEKIIEAETKEMRRRESLYRKGKKAYDFRNKTVILIDDGIATGMTLGACIQFLKKNKCKSIVIGAPVAHPHAVEKLEKEADRVVCVLMPDDLQGISQYYEEFGQVEDEEVCRLISQ
jgi:predicted phosphoribosyltransferase